MATLGLALASTPAVLFVGIIAMVLFAELDQARVRTTDAGHWWITVIVAYVLNLAYWVYEPALRRDREEKRLLDALVLYGKGRVSNYGHLSESGFGGDSVRSLLRDRVRVWAYSLPELWKEEFPGEKYPKDLFGIADGLMYYANKDAALGPEERAAKFTSELIRRRGG